MRLAWMTDIHLDMVGDVVGKIEAINNATRNSDAILITGDISISDMLVDHLSFLESVFQKPIYFVLGNHDYYGSNIGIVRRRVANLCNSSSYLKYISNVPYIKLDDGVNLVGHDGWYDAQNGDPYNDNFLMNDWLKIADFNSALRASFGGRTLNKNVIIQIARTLAQQSANHVANGIKSAIKSSRHIIVMTHVPPFKESFNASEKYKGSSALEILPWYTSKLMGDTLMAAAKAYPNVKFTVLSGHLHSHYDDDLLNNLTVKVGNANYGNPQLASAISI
jgi:predicted phosphohydrolase